MLSEENIKNIHPCHDVMLAVSLATFLGSKQVWIQQHSTAQHTGHCWGANRICMGIHSKENTTSDQHIGPELESGFYSPAPARETRGHTQGNLNNTNHTGNKLACTPAPRSFSLHHLQQKDLLLVSVS